MKPLFYGGGKGDFKKINTCPTCVEPGPGRAGIQSHVSRNNMVTSYQSPCILYSLCDMLEAEAAVACWGGISRNQQEHILCTPDGLI